MKPLTDWNEFRDVNDISACKSHELHLKMMEEQKLKGHCSGETLSTEYVSEKSEQNEDEPSKVKSKHSRAYVDMPANIYNSENVPTELNFKDNSPTTLKSFIYANDLHVPSTHNNHNNNPYSTQSLNMVNSSRKEAVMSTISKNGRDILFGKNGQEMLRTILQAWV